MEFFCTKNFTQTTALQWRRLSFYTHVYTNKTDGKIIMLKWSNWSWSTMIFDKTDSHPANTNILFSK
jgi:hypothetical protein